MLASIHARILPYLYPLYLSPSPSPFAAPRVSWTSSNFGPLLDLLGLYFQIRDDYANLKSDEVRMREREREAGERREELWVD